MILALVGAVAAPPLSPPATQTMQTYALTREDGLRVVYVHRPWARTVSVVSVVEGGMAAEPRDGLAHELADAWFASLPDGERTVSTLYGLLGAEAGVDVEADATVFWAHGSVASLRGLLELDALRSEDPLRGLEALTEPSRPTHRYQFSSHYFEPVFGALYPKSHPYQRIWRHPTQEVYFEDVVAYANESWTAPHTTTLIAGPMDPQGVLCAIDRSWCDAPPVAPEELTAVLALPRAEAFTFEPMPDPRFTDIGPLGAGVAAPSVLVAWSLPGTDAPGSGAAEYATTLVRSALQDERRPQGVQGPIRCVWLPGRWASTFVCVLPAAPDVKLNRWRRRLKKGWQVEGLDRRTAAWRHHELTEVMGSIDDPRSVVQLALERHRGGVSTVHGGRLERLAFAPEDVATLLEQFLSAERMVVVRLVPE